MTAPAAVTAAVLRPPKNDTTRRAGIVIVGGGQAGHQVASSLRLNGYGNPVVLISDESGLPYQRPPLSKDFLEPNAVQPKVDLADHDHYRTHDIELRVNERAVAIDRNARKVFLASGDEVEYEELVLATGVRARRLDVPGAESSGVYLLRTRDDAIRLRSCLPKVGRAVVIGAGFIGLEFASVASDRGIRVTVLEAASGIMTRSLSSHTSENLRSRHAARGVEVRTRALVSEILEENGRTTGVLLSDGSTIEADLVVVGIGVTPNVDLALEAGLEIDNGILVDSFLRTSDHHIYAVGDCVRFPTHFAPDAVRLESVQNAVDQARHVANNITSGLESFHALPWFWSHQAGVKLQIAGISTAHDSSVVRQGSGDSFSVFCFRSGKLIAVESVNAPRDHMAARRLLAAGKHLPPEVAADPAIDLKALALAS